MLNLPLHCIPHTAQMFKCCENCHLILPKLLFRSSVSIQSSFNLHVSTDMDFLQRTRLVLQRGNKNIYISYHLASLSISHSMRAGSAVPDRGLKVSALCSHLKAHFQPYILHTVSPHLESEPWEYRSSLTASISLLCDCSFSVCWQGDTKFGWLFSCKKGQLFIKECMHYLTAFPHRGGILMFPDQLSFKFFSFKVNFDFFFFSIHNATQVLA